MKRSIGNSLFLSFLLFLISNKLTCGAADTINTTDIIRDGDTIVSSAERFELGFFSPGNTTNRYVGIWYKKITGQTVIWVANRESPLRRNSTSSGVFTVNRSGQLVIRDDSNNIIWSSNTSRVARNPIAQLLGEFTLHLDITGYPQAVIRRGDAVQSRLGPRNGLRFSVRQSHIPIIRLSMNSRGIYYWEEATDESVVTRFTLSPGGNGQRLRWFNRSQEWQVSYEFAPDLCDTYNFCGKHASCNIGNSPACGCLDRFVPQDEQGWVTSDWSGGCVRRTALNCTEDVFLRYSGVKFPDSRFTWYNDSLSLIECEAMCLRDCSCTAYSNLDIRNGGSGCLLWFGDLVDIRDLPEAPQEIYIRMASSELGFCFANDAEEEKGKRLIIILTSLVGIVLLGLSLMLFVWKRKRNQKLREDAGMHNENNDDDIELPMYDLSIVTKATNGFSTRNKLGEGGFGSVYKGILEDGKEIAVKRLSTISSQGVEEFKNEVICIAKLQHRNLVKLLGCCIQGEEKMLIYEYMPNKSLDFFLFDETNRMSLDWPRRLHIINGIARGLMYLHQDSPLRIIHRDLKASNILLDSEMNPRISDFGIAKRVRGNETEDKTRRVVGTYGYMSPEYAFHGRFSAKLDVFSFGVLVLEIVSGKRNSSFSNQDHGLNLVGHAWILYKEGKSLELVDPCIVNSVYLNELQRSIHVALLCVQQHPEDRPNMSMVVLMLGSGGSGGVLPEAKQPGFFTTSRKDAKRPSIEYTITQLEAR
ncbi:g-type lectin s-receptor-like serine/threonine-protein kinase at4g27290 [Phtheirospermum japonicum]|uniref:Receptor-like serine/threonine-protein kinase n=1 Tax=Phtheirospermum japonicum TaxID=374723 RepID=A0A830C275_9LAMI|nr:g-type lectin s-receptor-like serine/threonine-protein kinase at4g27290 [Phtheirospermum japonicum]